MSGWTIVFLTIVLILTVKIWLPLLLLGILCSVVFVIAMISLVVSLIVDTICIPLNLIMLVAKGKDPKFFAMTKKFMQSKDRLFDDDDDEEDDDDEDD